MTTTTGVFREHIQTVVARAEQDWFRIESKATNTADIYLYDEIGMWGTTAAEFAGQVAGLDVNEIQLHINSPGGNAWDGLAIMNTLRQHKAKVVVTIDGLAASAASFIAMAGDEVVMAQGAKLMIHNSSGVAIGPADTMRQVATVLEGIDADMAKIYTAKAGGTAEQWRAAMAAETFYSGEQAVEAGLADRVDTRKGNEPAPKAHFAAAVAAFLGHEEPTTEPPSASASGSRNTTQEGSAVVDFTDDQLTNMRQAIGVADDADGATIVAALGEALAERAEPASDPVVPEGHVVIPAAQLADLHAGASAGMQAATLLRDQEREAFLDSVRTKFAPANREAWAKEFDRDPEGTRKHFASAPDIVALVPAGHGHDTETDEADSDYVALFGKEG